MTCDTCDLQMNYCFYINDEHWLKAVGKKEGYQCAHCILEKLGGMDWVIIWNEPTERIRENMEDTREDGQVRRERSHTPDCNLASDHEGGCPRPAEPSTTEAGQDN